SDIPKTLPMTLAALNIALVLPACKA
uniref:Uncharacterized protein n=1 Tax=Phlebotomus papatasi TaxID=29031 RepID=A0A8W9BFT3_PHLPP